MRLKEFNHKHYFRGMPIQGKIPFELTIQEIGEDTDLPCMVGLYAHGALEEQKGYDILHSKDKSIDSFNYMPPGRYECVVDSIHCEAFIWNSVWDWEEYEGNGYHPTGIVVIDPKEAEEYLQVRNLI